MRSVVYDREAAAAYAKKWALKRNPAFYDFENLGGDCTNFSSQCVFAGSGVMNYTPGTGWYYKSSYDRTPSWTAVMSFHTFMVNNKSVGPYMREATREDMLKGDVVQLGTASGRFYHTPFIVLVTADEIYVATHTYDSYMRPLSSYFYDRIRYLHVEGVRMW
jgi:hypothetical protein